MTTAIALAFVCFGVALLVSPWLLGRIRHWWTERSYSPKRHRGDLWLWEVEMRKKETHE